MAHQEPSPGIEALWRDHCAARFPSGVAGDEIAGVCVASLDTFAAGCIQSFLASAGSLDAERLAVLVSCSRDLATVVPEMNGEAKHCFARLEKLTTMVLDAVDRGTRPGRTSRST